MTMVNEIIQWVVLLAFCGFTAYHNWLLLGLENWTRDHDIDHDYAPDRRARHLAGALEVRVRVLEDRYDALERVENTRLSYCEECGCGKRCTCSTGCLNPFHERIPGEEW